MTESTAPKSQGWLWQWLIGIFFTALAIYLLSRIVNWDEIKLALSSIRLEQFLLVVFFYLISMVARAWGWQNLLQRRVSLGRAILGMNEGYFLNNILPFRLGELGRAFLIGRRTGMGTFAALSTVVVERAYDLAIAAGLLLSTLPFVLKMEWARPIAMIVLAIIIGALVFLYFAARNRERLIAWLDARIGKIGIMKRVALPAMNSLLEGFSVLNRFQMFALSLGALLLSWGLALVRDFILLRSIVADAPVWWAMLAISASNLGGAVPSMMASLGTFEGAATGAMVLAGAAPEVGLVYAVVIHVIHLISSSIFGAIGISQEGQSLTRLIANLRSMRQNV